MTQQEIISVIKTGNPVSIIRAGDGEKIVLEGLKDISTYNVILKRQLGYSPPIEHAQAIRENLIEAYEKADIIGVPMHTNLKDLSKNWQDVEKALDKYVPNRTDLTCSMDVFYDILYAGGWNEILMNRPVLNYISCRNLDEQFKHAFGIKQVNSFLIAPEAKYTSGYNGPVHYPDQYNKVQRWMTKCEIEGQICLVGGGFVGKNYCNWFRDLGGIALDIGAVFDLWAGKATRGKTRGMDVTRTEYML